LKDENLKREDETWPRQECYRKKLKDEGLKQKKDKSTVVATTTTTNTFNGCKLARFYALSFNRSIYVSSSPFDLIHSDVWKPSPVATKGKSRYYALFIDDHTCYCWVYLIKHRSEFFEIYTAFWALVKTQYSVVIKCFRCDLGWEYTSNKKFQLLALYETIHQTSCTDTPKQNRVAERKHRYIVKIARSLLLSFFVPSEFWRSCPYCCKFN